MNSKMILGIAGGFIAGAVVGAIAAHKVTINAAIKEFETGLEGKCLVDADEYEKIMDLLESEGLLAVEDEFEFECDPMVEEIVPEETVSVEEGYNEVEEKKLTVDSPNKKKSKKSKKKKVDYQNLQQPNVSHDVDDYPEIDLDTPEKGGWSIITGEIFARDLQGWDKERYSLFEDDVITDTKGHIILDNELLDMVLTSIEENEGYLEQGDLYLRNGDEDIDYKITVMKGYKYESYVNGDI